MAALNHYLIMKTQCTVFIAASLDGFIAKPDGDINWLHNPAYQSTEEMGYEPFIATVDALVMGRHSFEKVLAFDPWPYAVPVVVLSSTRNNVPEHLADRVTIVNRSPQELVSAHTKAGTKRLYIDGGTTIQRFLQAGLIDDMIITWIPILLGAGISLFGSFGHEVALELVSAESFDNGFVQTTYRVKP